MSTEPALQTLTIYPLYIYTSIRFIYVDTYVGNLCQVPILYASIFLFLWTPSLLSSIVHQLVNIRN